MINLKIEEFYKLVQNDGGTYEILTPDGFRPIGDVYKKNNKQIYQIELENGLKLKGSSDHLVRIDTSNIEEDLINDNIEILDGNTWLRLGNITKNDVVETNIGNSKPIIIEKLNKDTTYDLEVLDDKHEYLSNGIVSHNTGKTSLIDGLAQRIVDRKCSRVLFDKKIWSIDMGSIVQSTKYRGQFEERMKLLMTELENNPDVILFIDELHTIIGAGSTSGSLDASNMIKPALSRGEIQIIGATTLEEYRKHIEKDGALERRFQKVIVEPSTPEDTITILNNIKSKYEDHHKVIYTEEAIQACVNLTVRYITDRHLPDKAIDAMDEVGARVHIENIVVPDNIIDLEKKLAEIKEKKDSVIKKQKYEEAAKLRDVEKQFQIQLEQDRKSWEEDCQNNRKVVTDDNVAHVVSSMCNIPVTKVGKSENDRLKMMYNDLRGKVIGQDDAVKRVVKAIQRTRVGMGDPAKCASAMLIGNSGTGKSLLAKQIAKYLFDSEDAMMRLDMSEYMDKISSSKIIGAPPSYVGYDSETFLDRVRRKPYSVILLDEIEKADPSIFNLFLQMLDDGHMSDSHGRKVSFKNCIVLMTSNVGTRTLKDFGTGVGFGTKSKLNNVNSDIKAILEKELKNKFPPEFINRIDEIIYFRDLGKEEILQIVDLELIKSIKRALSIGYEIEIKESLKDHLIDVGYDPQYGARPMKRAIQTWVDDYITEYIIDNSPETGVKFELTYDGTNTVVELK